MSRRLAATGVALVLAATGGGTAWWASQRGHGRAAAGPPVPVGTATVVRTDLSTTQRLTGTLGYAGTYPVAAQAPGTVTALPSPGQVIARGQPVYELAGQPVRLFYGDRPGWRPLGSGVTDGPDVTELERNLVALGYANLAPDKHFGSATASAVRRWQQATGQPVTGTVDVGAVLYEPGAIRVATVAAGLGSPVGPGAPVLTATSTTPVVTVPVPAAQTYLVHLGDPVAVSLPDGHSATGHVTGIAPVATVSQEQGRPPVPEVPVTVSLGQSDLPPGMDQAPVAVSVVSQAVKGVLAVPVTALVALAGGGYGVYRRDGATRTLVAVTPGVYAGSLVEIRAGLKEGDVVEVPAG
jgi:peptidoglycan hydrolase-like protein with peptidoglycan-binding domain